MAKILKLHSGKQYKVIDENGKYYICEHTQFAKSNPTILVVEEVEEKPKAVQVEEKSEPTEDKPKKKTTAKKSTKVKKGE